MADNGEKITQLLGRLELLLKRQEDFSREVNQLRAEIHSLKTGAPLKKKQEEENLALEMRRIEAEIKKEKSATTYSLPAQKVTETVKRPASTENLPKIKSDIEKFIGENLISKIGIIITVIGVGIGAKYAIEHELISPLTRIVLGYLMGLGLLGFAIKLKKNYENFSAVLLSGAMAIVYFITYLAYDFYTLMPQLLAFLLMVAFTVFTVLAAIKYNKQVIALIGMAGAYAVPFLLSDGSGNVAVLFTYIVIINVGILLVAFKKYWKSLYYSSFVLTWLIYFLWYAIEYRAHQHFGVAISFLPVFFATFYLMFLAYKLIQKEKFNVEDIIMLIGNSLVFYGLGYALLSNHETGRELLGVFTLFNAVLHFTVGMIIRRQNLTDKNLFYLVVGLVLVFITITIPIQLDGNWVTLMWAGEASLLFWIGRTKNVSFYELLSYPLMVLAFFSITHDWINLYNVYNPEYPETRITPLLNVNFLSSVLFIAAFGFIQFLSTKERLTSEVFSQKEIVKVFSVLIPIVFLSSIYFSFLVEIQNYWHQLFADSTLEIKTESEGYMRYIRDFDLERSKSIWIINYSLLFLSVLSFINLKKLKNQYLGYISLGLSALTIVIFLSIGLFLLSELRESYLKQIASEYYYRGQFHIGIRYVSLAFLALVLFVCHKHKREQFLKWGFATPFAMAFDILLHISALWAVSSELINWMDIVESGQSYKLGLSILWGIYALFLISLGIWKNKKYLRIGAIILFGLTLIKLFFYDISHLDTIAKTVVFVSLGILLLIVSFLYNKYKHIISGDTEN